MRVRKLARRVGQVVAAAAFGVVLTFGAHSANADEQTGDEHPESGAEIEAPGWEAEPGGFGATPNFAPGWE